MRLQRCIHHISSAHPQSSYLIASVLHQSTMPCHKKDRRIWVKYVAKFIVFSILRLSNSLWDQSVQVRGGGAVMPCTVITLVHGSRNSIEGLTRWSTMIEMARDGDEHEGSPSSNRPGIDRTMNDGGGCGCPREHVGPVGRTPTRLSQLRVHFEGIRFPWDPIDWIVWPSPANNSSLLH